MPEKMRIRVLSLAGATGRTRAFGRAGSSGVVASHAPEEAEEMKRRHHPDYLAVFTGSVKTPSL
jgi:hypothetical protein